ncbi:hypothetical protein [Holophaga foetida]|uniref:hypothetical protein n=1 Tax=Holophaga foetida TaxID=35839 RepID=UPI0002475093|nr:hypothetical protein [Holophaga foetida]
MHTKSRSQAGEGKLGCIISLAVLVVLGGIAYKLGPAYMHKNTMEDTASDLASRAGIMSVEAITKQLRAKATELEIQEALAPGAIQVRTTGGKEGTCTVTLRFTQKIDLYGVTTVDFATDKTVSKPYMDAR